MITALDTNVLSALTRGEANASAIAKKLDSMASAGSLMICGPVFLELAAVPGLTFPALEKFLTEMGIQVDFDMDEGIWRLAASGFRSYCIRRRRSKGNPPKRFAADFLIGAHAARRAGCLLTLDPAPYRNSYPELVLERL